jgi:outer membrane protein
MIALGVALEAARILSLSAALDTASAHQPQLRQAHADLAAARARTDQARAPLLPQLSGTASYQRTTANFVARPGFVPSSATGMMTAPPNFNTFNFYNFSLTLNQLAWDWGWTIGRWRSVGALADAQADTERVTRLTIDTQVRVAFFNARANKALVEVARATLANQDRHLQQITGFVEIGTRPAIDLAQARTDRANSQVQLINAENAYETSKAQLNQAMGVEGPTDYDVADETLPPFEGEDLPEATQLAEAARMRPDLASARNNVRAQELNLKALKGNYGPAFGASMTLNDQGSVIDNLAWNWNVTVTANWAIFSGLQTWAQVKEAKAVVDSTSAQLETLDQSVRLDVVQSRLALRAAKAALGASEEALVNARERLSLAEGRYQAGVGNVIELGDAQVALTSAAAQRVQAEYNVSTARAQLMRALGRQR